MPTIASLIVRIGAQDQEIQNALAAVGQKAKSVDADLKKLGNTPLASQAQKSMDSLRATMQQVTDAQQRVAERARLAAQGLEAMGGASRLTDAQLKQVNRTLQDGLSSYQALGKEAPAQLQKVADAVKGKLDQPLGEMNAKMIALGTAIGTFFSQVALQVGRALIESGKAAFTYADSLKNLSTATSVSVGGLQRIEALGISTGVSLETLANSVGMLQKNLDSKAGLKALSDMGLSFDQIRKLKPENQFLEIAKAIAATEDPIEKQNRGTALFGRQWMTIAPAITGNIDEIIKKTRQLSDETVDALDEAGDAWDEFKKDTDKRIAEFLGNLVLSAKKAQLAWADLLSPQLALQKLVRGGVENAADFAKGLETILKGTKSPFSGGGGPNTPLDLDDETEYLEILKKSDEALKKSIESGLKFKAVQDQLFGRAIIANAEELVRALGSTENLTKLTEASTKKLHDELGQAIAVYRAMGREVPPTLQTIFDRTRSVASMVVPIRTLAEGLKELTAEPMPILLEQVGTLDEFLKSVGARSEPLKAVFEEPLPAAKKFDDTLKDLSRSFAQLAQVSDGAFGDIVRDIGMVITAMQLAVDSVKMIQAGLAQLKAGQKTQGALGIAGGVLAGGAAVGQVTSSGGIASRAAKGALTGGLLGAQIGTAIFPVLGTAAGAAIGAIAGAIVGVWRGIAAKIHKEMQVNPIRDTFFEQLGGLVKLNPIVKELTGNFEAVQAVFDARNPEQYAAAVANLNAILEIGKQRFADLQASVGVVTEKLSGVTMITPEIQRALDAVFDESTTQGYLEAIETLNGELDKQAGKYRDIESTLQKYGIAFKDAGKEFQQAKINERAIELRKDFDILKTTLPDINAGMRGMGQTIRDFVKDAKAFGVEVPESMREVIQVAIDAGEVFDEDGKKITDITQLGLTFGTTMERTMKIVSTAVDRLTIVLEGLAKFLGITLPKAAEAGAEKVTDALDNIEVPDLTVEVDFDFDKKKFPKDWPVPGDFPVEGAATGAQVKPWGLQHFAKGTDTIPAMLTPGEMVLNKDQQGAIGSALSGNKTTVELHFHSPVLDGPSLKRFLNEHVWPDLPSALLHDVGGSRRVVARIAATTK